jgi:NitT/TauT family transport system substrate-binding protein
MRITPFVCLAINLIVFGLFSCVVAAKEQITIGSLGHTFGFLQLDVAESKGWLETSRLDSEVVYFKSGKDCATALLQGHLDAAILGVDHAITGQKEGTAIRQLALLNQLPGWTFVVSSRLKGQVSSPADLHGMNIGVTSPGSATHILTTFLLARHGVSQADFTTVKAGVATLPDILRKEGIDAGMALEPYGSRLAQSGDATILVDFRSAVDVEKHLDGTYPLTALLVRQDTIDRSPTAVQELTNAIVWACKAVASANADDILAQLPTDYVPSPEAWRSSFDASRDVFSPDGKTDVQGIKTIIDAQVVFGKMTTPDEIDVDALYDSTFWEKANALPLPANANIWANTQDEGQGTMAQTFFAITILIFLAIGIFLLMRRKDTNNE